MPATRISDRLAVILRERLALYRRCANPEGKPLTVNKVIDDLLRFGRTIQETERDASQRNLLRTEIEWGQDTPIDVETMRQYLRLEARWQLNRHLPMFMEFLLHERLLCSFEAVQLERIAERHQYDVPALIKPIPKINVMISAIEGEYIFDGDCNTNSIYHILAYQRGKGGPICIEVRHFIVSNYQYGEENRNNRAVCSSIEYGMAIPFKNKSLMATFPSTELIVAARLEALLSPNPLAVLYLSSKTIDAPRLGIYSDVPNGLKYVKIDSSYRDLREGSDYRFTRTSVPIDDLNSNTVSYTEADDETQRLVGGIKSGNVRECIAAIFSGADVNWKDLGSLMTPLHWAAHVGSREIYYILRYGSALDFEEEAALVEAAIDGFENAEEIRHRLEECAIGLDILARDARGCHASAHVRCEEVATASGRAAWELYTGLQREECRLAQRRGQRYAMQAPRGTPYSKIEIDPDWFDELEPS